MIQSDIDKVMQRLYRLYLRQLLQKVLVFGSWPQILRMDVKVAHLTRYFFLENVLTVD